MQLIDPDPIVLGLAIRDLRRAIGSTQRELAARSGFSQSLIAAIELGQIANVSIATIERLLVAMGARFEVRIDAPFLVDRRGQADRAHARCVAYVADHLERAGWLVATEVGIGRQRSHGWIDVLAWHPETHVLLVTEVKTEIHDVGAIERAPRRHLAMIDPMSQRAEWLRPFRIDGRRSAAPHADYASFVRARQRRSRAHRSRRG